MRNKVKLLAELFSKLTKRQKANLRYHLDNKTPILCGKKAEFFVEGEAG